MIITIDVYLWQWKRDNWHIFAYLQHGNLNFRKLCRNSSPALVMRMNWKKNHDRSFDGRWLTRSHLDDHNHYVYIIYIYIFIAYIIHIYIISRRERMKETGRERKTNLKINNITRGNDEVSGLVNTPASHTTLPPPTLFISLYLSLFLSLFFCLFSNTRNTHVHTCAQTHAQNTISRVFLPSCVPSYFF